MNKKILILFTTILTFMIGLNSVYAACDESVVCNTNFGHPLLAGCKNSNIHPTRIYKFDDGAYGFCYLDKEKEVVGYEVRTGTCEDSKAADVYAIAANNQNAYYHEQLVGTNLGVYRDDYKNQGLVCADYAQRKTVNGASKYYFYYNKDNKYKELITDKDAKLGEIVYDPNSMESIKSCIGPKIFTQNFCSNSDKNNYIESTIKNCFDEFTLGYSDSLYNKYKNELQKFYGENTYSYALKNCNILSKCLKGTNAESAARILTIAYMTAKIEDGKSTSESFTFAYDAAKNFNYSFTQTEKNCLENELTVTSTKIDNEAKNLDNTTSAAIEDGIDEQKEEFSRLVDPAKIPNIPISNNITTCEQLLGDGLVKLVKFCVRLFCIAGAIIAIVNGMIILLPAVAKKDSDELKKSEKKLVSLAIILVLIILLPVILKVLGFLFNYDLTCFSWK